MGMVTVRFARVIGIGMLLGACATSGGTAGRGGSRDRTTLTTENLRPHAKRTLYEVISLERPQWLVKRGVAGLSTNDPDDIVVYLDGQKMGGPEHLRDVTADVVASVQFLSGPEAQTRFGMNHQYGAIIITTLKR
jgi:hypothetical protein